MIGLPYLLAGGLAASVVAFGGGYLKGNADGNANGERRVQAMLAASEKAKGEEALQGARAATTLEVKNAAARVVSQTNARRLNPVAARPIYIRECFDTDGLALANAALAGVEVMIPPQPLPARPVP